MTKLAKDSLNEAQFKELLLKVQQLKSAGGVDLSTEEDLSVAIMNLISLEEHFYFTAEKTNKTEYFDFMNEVRQMRKQLMARMIDRHEGESWCICKHLLATTMRLIEVGGKLQQDGKTAQAKETFDYGYKLYSLFWALRLKLLDSGELKQKAAAEQPWQLKDIVAKLVDCCDE